MFFMALVARLVNDPSVACRVMYEQALKTLLQVQFRAFTIVSSVQCPACTQPVQSGRCNYGAATAPHGVLFSHVD